MLPEGCSPAPPDTGQRCAREGHLLFLRLRGWLRERGQWDPAVLTPQDECSTRIMRGLRRGASAAAFLDALLHTFPSVSQYWTPGTLRGPEVHGIEDVLPEGATGLSEEA